MISTLANVLNKSYKVFAWNNIPMESRYFADIAIGSQIQCDLSEFYTQGVITVIPEPATFSLLLLGMVVIKATRRKASSEK